MIIDHKLNWTQHIGHVKNKVSKGIGIMYRARNYLTKNSLKSLYFSYIYPYLIYCVEIWGISPQTHLKSLRLLQKKIVRIMTFSTYCAHTGLIFKDLNILKINQLVIHRIGIMMYKFSKGLLPTILNSLYQENNEVHTYNTRAKIMFHICFGTQSFSSVRVKIWNVLILSIYYRYSYTTFFHNVITLNK